MTPKPTDRRTWELALLARATRFVVSTPVPNGRGQRKQWNKTEFYVCGPGDLVVSDYAAKRSAQLRAASNHARALGPRALIYAVDDASGEQYALSREDWL